MFTTLANIAVTFIMAVSLNSGANWSAENLVKQPHRSELEKEAVNQHPKLIYTIDTVVIDDEGKSQRIFTVKPATTLH